MDPNVHVAYLLLPFLNNLRTNISIVHPLNDGQKVKFIRLPIVYMDSVSLLKKISFSMKTPLFIKYRNCTNDFLASL